MGDQKNSDIRIKALLKELDRQQLEVKKKKNVIRLIVAVISFVFLITFAAVYSNLKMSKDQIIHVERNDGDLVKEEKVVPKKIQIYQLVFKNFNQYPLARFFNEKDALSFQSEMLKLQLPKTFIHTDSLDGKERVLTISSNYRYYIQFGIFKHKLLPDLSKNMIYLHQINDKDLFKYRLGPFAKNSQAEKLVKDLKLKDYLIVEVSR